MYRSTPQPQMRSLLNLPKSQQREYNSSQEIEIKPNQTRNKSMHPRQSKTRAFILALIPAVGAGVADRTSIRAGLTLGIGRTTQEPVGSFPHAASLRASIVSSNITRSRPRAGATRFTFLALGVARTSMKGLSPFRAFILAFCTDAERDRHRTSGTARLAGLTLGVRRAEEAGPFTLAFSAFYLTKYIFTSRNACLALGLGRTRPHKRAWDGYVLQEPAACWPCLRRRGHYRLSSEQDHHHEADGRRHLLDRRTGGHCLLPTKMGFHSLASYLLLR